MRWHFALGRAIAAARHDGPVFRRLSRAEVGRNEFPEPLQIGIAWIRKKGSDVAPVTTGHILERALQAAKKLESKGYSVTVIDLHTVKPLDESVILTAAQKCGCMVTCEEHNVIGGMGSIVSRFSSKACPIPIRMAGIQDQFGQSGSHVDLQRQYDVTAQAIVDAAERVMQQKKGN